MSGPVEVTDPALLAQLTVGLLRRILACTALLSIPMKALRTEPRRLRIALFH